jgi:FkbM family methyltransferase
MLRRLQSFLLANGVELRKSPASQVSQLSVFTFAVYALIRQSTGPVKFIQVGANDGVYGDPLRHYVERYGWRGMLVEPQPDVFARLRENYSHCAERLIFENLAVSPERGSLVLYRVPGEQALPGQKMQDSLTVTSANPRVVARQAGVAASLLERVEVEAVRLDDLIARHQFEDFDLLQVDCEGYDGEVMKSIDLARYRPKIVQFEHGHLTRPDLDQLERRLSLHQYHFLYGGRFADSLAVSSEFMAGLA